MAPGIKRMLGFRNITVRENYKINLEEERSFIEDHQVDFREFVSISAKLI